MWLWLRNVLGDLRHIYSHRVQDDQHVLVLMTTPECRIRTLAASEVKVHVQVYVQRRFAGCGHLHMACTRLSVSQLVKRLGLGWQAKETIESMVLHNGCERIHLDGILYTAQLRGTKSIKLKTLDLRNCNGILYSLLFTSSPCVSCLTCCPEPCSAVT